MKNTQANNQQQKKIWNNTSDIYWQVVILFFNKYHLLYNIIQILFILIVKIIEQTIQSINHYNYVLNLKFFIQFSI